MLRLRHTLAHLWPDARPALLPAIHEALPVPMRGPDMLERVDFAIWVQGIPGIVCRPLHPGAAADGHIGFAFPFRVGSDRVKAAVPVWSHQIRAFTDPWTVFRRALEVERVPHPALPALAGLERDLGVRLGLIGSVALETMTGAGYLHSESDLDLVVDGSKGLPPEALPKAVATIADAFGVKLDVEILFSEGRGVKMDEFFSKSRTILVKEIDRVSIEERDRFIDIIA